jgi:hypothetical protein
MEHGHDVPARIRPDPAADRFVLPAASVAPALAQRPGHDGGAVRPYPVGGEAAVVDRVHHPEARLPPQGWPWKGVAHGRRGAPDDNWDGTRLDEQRLLNLLAGLRRAPVGGSRAPHKPLLLLWLFARYASTGSSVVPFSEAEAAVSQLIDDYGPPVAGRNRRAVMPFVHLERELWRLTDAAGDPIPSTARESRRMLLDAGAVGGLRAEVEQALSAPQTFTRASRFLLDQHFTPTLATLICDNVGLDLSAEPRPSAPLRRPARRAGFTEEVLRAYGFACACAASTGRWAGILLDCRLRTCSGIHTAARTASTTAWRCACCITPCSTSACSASAMTGAFWSPATTCPAVKPAETSTAWVAARCARRGMPTTACMRIMFTGINDRSSDSQPLSSEGRSRPSAAGKRPAGA